MTFTREMLEAAPVDLEFEVEAQSCAPRQR
jgi:hypothetical protein